MTRTTTRTAVRQRLSVTRPKTQAEAKRRCKKDIIPVDRPVKRDTAPVMTERMEDFVKRTITHHHLPKRHRRASVLSVGSDEEVLADGRIKYLRKREKKPWKGSENGESREWDGVRLNGQTYWVSLPAQSTQESG